MDVLPFLLAAASLAGSFAVAALAAGWRPAVDVIGATVVTVSGISVDPPTFALALLLLTVLVAVRFPWREPVALEIILGEDSRLPRVRRVRTR